MLQIAPATRPPVQLSAVTSRSDRSRASSISRRARVWISSGNMNAASKKILIADDDSSVRLVLSQAFTRLGYQVRATGNATTLLKWVTDGEGDLIVTDVMMPDENVFDVLPRIRKERPKLPIIVMSAQNTLLTAVNAADAGAFEYVSKPFDLDDVTAAARRALSRPADAEASKAQARAMEDHEGELVLTDALNGTGARVILKFPTTARLAAANAQNGVEEMI